MKRRKPALLIIIANMAAIPSHKIVAEPVARIQGEFLTLGVTHHLLATIFIALLVGTFLAHSEGS